MTSPIDHLFTAERVAVVGASASRPDATGNQVLRNLARSRVARTLIPVSPNADVLEGYPTVASIALLPQVDLAIVAVGGSRVAAVVEELEAVGCPVVLVMSIDVDPAGLERLGGVHARGTTEIHGPNCMGVIDVVSDMHAWADEGNLDELPRGPIALISQSGSGAIFVARSLDQFGLSRVISSGNEVGLTTADYLGWLATDKETTAIGIVVESISDGATFEAAVRAVRAAGKRVVALKVGRTPQGALATVAHTGALVSRDDTYAALFRRLGVPLVSDYDELASSLQLAASLDLRTVDTANVGVITISGGQAALAADIAASVGVATAPFSDATVAALRGLDPHTAATNPFDAAAGAQSSPEEFAEAVRIIGADENISAVMVVLDAQITLSDMELGFEDEYFETARSVQTETPVVIVSSSSVSLHPSRLREFAHGRPLIRGIRNAFVALRSASVIAENEIPSRPADLPGPAELSELLVSIGEFEGPVDSSATNRLLQRYGIPLSGSRVITDVTAAQTWAQSNGFPCVLKIASPDIPHRSDIGAVALGVQNEAALEEAWHAIMRNVATHAPTARIEGIEIQPHLEGRIEAFVGFVSDDRLGATVGVGLGGVLVELLGDVSRAAAPVGMAEAAAVIGRTRLSRILGGYRSLHDVTPTDSLAEAVSRISWLARDFTGVLVEADLNPVLVEPGTGRVSIIDALLVARSARTTDETKRSHQKMLESTLEATR